MDWITSSLREESPFIGIWYEARDDAPSNCFVAWAHPKKEFTTVSILILETPFVEEHVFRYYL